MQRKKRVIRFGVWDYFTLYTERCLWIHIKDKHKDVILQWFGVLPWRERRGWAQGDQEKHIQPFPKPELWRQCQHMHGSNVWCCQRGCTSALFSHANQSPRDCCRDLPHYTNWAHESTGGEKKLGVSWDRRGRSSPAVGALGGQWIQFSAPEWNEVKLERNKEHTMEHCCWDIQETSKV